ncbi:peroxiredoxin [Paenibacillus sp. FJAT-26967]|uniref:peroxiredoxin family protein n=1 Tax=Paenibacillus sp. FJAT-26967 TaxID=1729690 RepID=UPI0008394464|nr:TlpA disulfide reductase family protein [Paenibacillus sp. FJAT-26967]
MKKSILGMLILAGLIAYGFYDYYNSKNEELSPGAQVDVSNREEGIQKGQIAPDFDLTDLAGNPVKLSEYRGKTVFVNFWATWCPPCRAEMPHMQKVHDKYKDKNVVFLAVNLTHTEEKPAAVHEFADNYGLTFPIVLDEEGKVSKKYQIVAYPTTYIVDKQGVIREKYQGAINDEIMEDAIKRFK